MARCRSGRGRVAQSIRSSTLVLATICGVAAITVLTSLRNLFAICSGASAHPRCHNAFATGAEYNPSHRGSGIASSPRQHLRGAGFGHHGQVHCNRGDWQWHCTTRKAVVSGAVEVVTDLHVPEAHRGLHSSLYGEGPDAAEATHGVAVDQGVLDLPGHLDGSELLNLQTWLQQVKTRFKGEHLLANAIGLFALYDSSARGSQPWKVGYSRRVHFDLARIRSPRDQFVRIKLLHDDRMWTRARLEERQAAWLEELGVSVQALGEKTKHVDGLSSTSQLAAAEGYLGQSEKEAFEERKWKLQLAMGQRLADEDEAGSSDSTDEQRRARLRQAVEGDDWSAVIAKQANVDAAPADGTAPRTPTSSPFASSQGAQVSTEGIARSLSVKNVHAVLEAVRPILVADGGDVEVLGVNPETGTVTIAMLGACTSCPAAPSTIASGIEKSLVDHFGADVVREVVRVDAGAEATSDQGMRAALEAHLGELRGSLVSEGAKAEMHLAEDGRLHIDFEGSDMLCELVRSSLTYRFPQFAGRFQVQHLHPAAAPSHHRHHPKEASP